MSQPRMGLPREVEDALRASGLPWELRNGGSHLKLFVAGRLVQVVSRSRRQPNHQAERNMIANVRRALRSILAQPT